MSEDERRDRRDGPGGGEGTEPEPGPCAPSGTPARRPRTKPVRVYTPEERRAAHRKSGLKPDAFARTFGVSPITFQAWRRAYREEGPKGLEHPFGKRKRGRKTLAPALREEIVAVKRRFPDFGLRRIRDFLSR